MVPDELVYSGSISLDQIFDDIDLDAGKLVLSPTRTYAPSVLTGGMCKVYLLSTFK
jgi:phosphoribosylformylglycinamidine cyclo-ligase